MTAHARKHQIIKIFSPLKTSTQTCTHKSRKTVRSVYPSQRHHHNMPRVASAYAVVIRGNVPTQRGCIIRLMLTLLWPRAELCCKSLLLMKLLLSCCRSLIQHAHTCRRSKGGGLCLHYCYSALPPFLRNDLKSAGKSKSRKLQKTDEGQAMLWW